MANRRRLPAGRPQPRSARGCSLGSRGAEDTHCPGRGGWDKALLPCTMPAASCACCSNCSRDCCTCCSCSFGGKVKARAAEERRVISPRRACRPTSAPEPNRVSRSMSVMPPVGVAAAAAGAPAAAAAAAAFCRSCKRARMPFARACRSSCPTATPDPPGRLRPSAAAVGNDNKRLEHAHIRRGSIY